MAINLPEFLRSDAMRNGIKAVLNYVIILWMGGVAYGQEIKEPDKTVSAFRFEVNDSIQVNVDLIYKKNGCPSHYAAHLETDVCSDSLCKPISIIIYWDLLGHFFSYKTTKGQALTKFDHISFTEEDHRHLHRILADTGAILRDYAVEDMIDSTVHVRSYQIDAVTRPTSITFDGATVEGALYTVYTLWHFANGSIRAQMQKHTLSLLSDTLIRHMLYSDNRDYVTFIFKNWTKEQNSRFVEDVICLVGNPDKYIPHFALAQLEDSLIVLPNYQQQLLTFFPQVDNSVKNVLLDRLASVQLEDSAMEVLLHFLSNLDLQESQIQKIFFVIERNKTSINKKVHKKLQALSQKQDNTMIARHAKYILTKIN